VDPQTFRVVGSLFGAGQLGFAGRLARRCVGLDRADVLGELSPVIDAAIAEGAHVGTTLAIRERLEHLSRRGSTHPAIHSLLFRLG